MIDIIFKSVFFKRKRIQSVVQEAVKAVFSMHKIDSFAVTVLVTNDRWMRVINYEQRQIDWTTDVLSFPSTETFTGESDGFYGDIVVSVPRAKAQAKEYGQSFERELAFLIIHGCLHLLGFDHEHDDDETKMREAQRAVIKHLEEKHQ